LIKKEFKGLNLVEKEEEKWGREGERFSYQLRFRLLSLLRDRESFFVNFFKG